MKQKFRMFEDVGEVVVKTNFVHETCLYELGSRCISHDVNMTDENFHRPSQVLRAGDRFHVRGFVSAHITSSKQIMSFLEEREGTFYAGAQGLAVVIDQVGVCLPVDMWYSSFDRVDRLWMDPSSHWGRCRVPNAYVSNTGGFVTRLGRMEVDWGLKQVILEFSNFRREAID